MTSWRAWGLVLGMVEAIVGAALAVLTYVVWATTLDKISGVTR